MSSGVSRHPDPTAAESAGESAALTPVVPPEPAYYESRLREDIDRVARTAHRRSSSGPHAWQHPRRAGISFVAPASLPAGAARSTPSSCPSTTCDPTGNTNRGDSSSSAMRSLHLGSSSNTASRPATAGRMLAPRAQASRMLARASRPIVGGLSRSETGRGARGAAGVLRGADPATVGQSLLEVTARRHRRPTINCRNAAASSSGAGPSRFCVGARHEDLGKLAVRRNFLTS